MCQANHANTIPAPVAREDFDEALIQSQIIVRIITDLVDVNGVGNPCTGTLSWLAGELHARLERIEVADMTMRGTRA